MGFVRKIFILAAVAVAILSQIEVKENKWMVSKSVVLKASLEDTFRFLTSLDYVDKWFPFVSRVRDADSKPLAVGKKLYAVYDVPAYGEYEMLYRVTEHKRGELLAIEGNNILMPRVEFKFRQQKDNVCKLTINVSFQRKSYFFQYVVAPVLNFLVNQKLQHSLFLLKSVFPY